MRIFLNKRSLIVISIVLILIYGASYFFLKRSSTNTPEEIDFTKVSSTYKDFKLGVSTENELREKLGTPLDETLSGDKKILEYSSNNPNFNNEITISSDKVYFVKEIISPEDNVSITSLKNKYGQYKNTLYGQSSEVGFDLFPYPEKGVAFVGNEKTGDVIEVWYFSPNTYENFKNLYAKDFTEDFRQTSH